MPTLKGAVRSESNSVFDSGMTINGDRNCPRYRAAERRGITVVAEFLPPLMLAMVFRYGTPTPLATPMNAEPRSMVLTDGIK